MRWAFTFLVSTDKGLGGHSQLARDFELNADDSYSRQNPSSPGKGDFVLGLRW